MDWGKWIKAAGIRAIKTGAQALVTLLGANVVSITTLDWALILGCVATMMVLSLATSLAGLPELDAKEDETE